MKTYEQTIDLCAKAMYHKYMRGSDDYHTVDGVKIIAYIFDRTSELVLKDIQTQFNDLCKKQFKDY
jgi:hypothetical protein